MFTAHNFRSLAVFVLASFIVIFSASCAKDLVTGKKAYNWFSVGEDVKLGSQVMAEQIDALRRKGKKVDNEADSYLFQRVKTVTERIVAVSHYPSFPYEAHFADVDVVNAWCAPGGKVMVYSGLFDPKKGLVSRDKEDELAAVLGHEIAHATARHVSESLSRNYTIMAVGQIAVSAIASSGAGTLQNAFNRVIVEGINLYIPFYSRSNEAEADRIGIMYMAKAGYDPKVAVALWYRACQSKGDSYSLFASHPSSCQRAKALEEALPVALVEYNKVGR